MTRFFLPPAPAEASRRMRSSTWPLHMLGGQVPTPHP
uniref:Uncharacterized protein n=1 Tax=Arundo donax TaxID=35708 RepID=A0A0A9DT99_ARUDO